MKFLQTKPLVKSMKINYFDLYYTVNETRDEKEFIDDKSEKDCSNFNDFKTSNHSISTKPRETIFRYRNLRSDVNHSEKFLLYK